MTRPAPATTVLPPAATSIRAARAFVHDVLVNWGRADLCEAAVLATSEVVTNAALHAGSTIAVTVHASPDGVVVECRDTVPSAVPRMTLHSDATADLDAEAMGGRGLVLVSGVAAEWGVDVDAAGKTVWFRVGGQAGASGSSARGGAAADPDVGRRPGGRPVSLRGIPVALALANSANVTDLARELQWLQMSDPEVYASLPADVVDGFARSLAVTAAGRFAGRQAARSAASAGLSHYDVELHLRPVDAAELRSLNERLEAVERSLPADRVLYTASPDELKRFRRWCADELDRQLAGAAPTPW